MPRILLLTSTFLRHQYFIHALCRQLDVIGVWREEKSFKPEEYAGNDDDRAVIAKHFDARDRSEEQYFKEWGDQQLPRNMVVHDLPPNTINTPGELAAMRALQPELILVFGSGILREGIIEAFAGKIINLHLGLSPYYRGSGTNFWPLVNGEPEYVGATIHYLDAGIDSGDIICHVRPTITPEGGPHDLGNAAIIAAVEALPAVVSAHARRTIHAAPQRTDIGKLYLRKHFNADAVRTLYANFARGMILDYLREKDARVSAPRISVGYPCAVVMYHYIRDADDSPFRGIYALSTMDFQRQLDWFTERYRIIHYDEFVAAVQGKHSFNEPAALLTFDDGLLDHYITVFPILRDRGLSGVLDR